VSRLAQADDRSLPVWCYPESDELKGLDRKITQIAVSRAAALETPLVVTLGSSSPAQLSVPGTVTIPASAASVVRLAGPS
jgi:hypothetical protein